ncbi:MAG: hypothetical protein D6718_11535 [Acidobacteria bacterium]|nr:MAG: hypothetical protein D6718_11535 [Acidobacteriota bacterium]
MRTLIVVMVLGLAGARTSALAQQSASYRMDEHVLDQGGRPADGVTASSASYRVSLDSLGEGLVRAGLASATYHMDGSFGAAYPPPGEVLGLRFADQQTLAWSPERSVGVYEVYRDGLAAIAGGGYGTCWQQDVAGESVTDSDPIAPGEGFFYLVTARNRLDEEGTKGRDSAGSDRAGSACP